MKIVQIRITLIIKKTYLSKVRRSMFNYKLKKENFTI